MFHVPGIRRGGHRTDNVLNEGTHVDGSAIIYLETRLGRNPSHSVAKLLGLDFLRDIRMKSGEEAEALTQSAYKPGPSFQD
jgi:hypothetical protein